MKKIISLIMAIVMIATLTLTLASCGKSDWEKIEEKGTIVVGYTRYAPMNFYDADGDLKEDVDGDFVGFDTEFAKLVGEKLGVEVKFQEIKWENKYIELNAGNIDCIWNGFTSNTKDDDGVERADKVDFTYAYADNKQCVVVKKDKLSTITSVSSLDGKTGAAEKGSAGETYAKSVTSVEIVTKDKQTDTFLEVKSGAVDFVVVDILLAQNIVGQGNFDDLAIVPADIINIDPEVYSIGCRKNSDLDEKINEAIVELLNEGKLDALAEKYGVRLTDTLVAKKTEK